MMTKVSGQIDVRPGGPGSIEVAVTGTTRYGGRPDRSVEVAGDPDALDRAWQAVAYALDEGRQRLGRVGYTDSTQTTAIC